jgi:transposase
MRGGVRISRQAGQGISRDVDTYVEASRAQSVADWLASHVRALAYFGGAPRAIVPDNLKSGVTKAST